MPHSLPLLLVLHVQHTAHPAAESCTAQEAPAINRLSQPAHCMLQKLLLRWSQPLWLHQSFPGNENGIRSCGCFMCSSRGGMTAAAAACLS